jgi:hypothetical protein
MNVERMDVFTRMYVWKKYWLLLIYTYTYTHVHIDTITRHPHP